MNREEKKVIINSLAEKLTEYSHFYITDTSELNAEQTAALRKLCFEQEVKLIVVKNTLFIKALEQVEKAKEELMPALKGETAIMFANVGKGPAKLIKEFRKANPKPVLKAAVVEDCVYLGEASLEELVNIKSREELIGEIVGLLQSPAKNVISALQGSAGHKVAGLVKALEERG
ncbi:50S ribosomal protein L10 [uncultured Alistipes sp.]|uniref:50S ribosomal protein L10 n=1 Tax=uncultured Alistipes sp. TaxID=538949 RepID=UPI002636BA2A|nr:50S ribosomal protein L10 [uncultured Alistipes sp.]